MVAAAAPILVCFLYLVFSDLIYLLLGMQDQHRKWMKIEKKNRKTEKWTHQQNEQKTEMTRARNKQQGQKVEWKMTERKENAEEEVE